jgi:hypothetical protein
MQHNKLYNREEMVRKKKGMSKKERE